MEAVLSPLEWDFTIREGVKFQDGTALTAEAVAGSLNHVLDAKVPARAFNRKVVSGVTALDASTVRVTTPTESPLVPYRLASVNTGILAPAAYKGENRGSRSATAPDPSRRSPRSPSSP